MQDYQNVTRKVDSINSQPGGDQPPPPPPGGGTPTVVYLVVIAIIAILIGMLLPAVQKSAKPVNDTLHALGYQIVCAPDPGTENVASKPKGGKGTKGTKNQHEYYIVTMSDLLVSSYRPADGKFTLGDVLIGLDALRVALGSESILPPCGDPLPAPDNGSETVDEGAATESSGGTGGETGGSTGGSGGTTGGGQPAPVSTPDDGSTAPDGGLCAANGGIQWQGQTCVCPGKFDNVTVCNDGTKIDQMTDQACTPDQSCDQPTDPQNPPSGCACNYVCVQEKPDSNECTEYGYRDCNGNACSPDIIP
jgi:hypothetical protein